MRFRMLALMVLLVACGQPTSQTPSGSNQATEPTTITVFAAASLTDALNEAGPAFTAHHPSIIVQFNFAGSQQLAQQIVEGAPADLFLSANLRQAHVVRDANLTTQISELATNEAVLVVAVNNPLGIATVADLGKPGLRVVLADAAVPAGEYAEKILHSSNAEYGSTTKASVTQNIISYEQNIRAAVGKVALGEADATLAYATDVVNHPDLMAIKLPDTLQVHITYPLVSLAESRHPNEARLFAEFLLNPDGQAILMKHGFLPPLNEP